MSDHEQGTGKGSAESPNNQSQIADPKSNKFFTPERKQKIIKESKAIALIIVLVVSFRYTIFDHYKVPTGSMIPTILPGDRLLVNKMAYDFKVPLTEISLFEVEEMKRGDVVVFNNPRDPSILFVKRLFGLPGDRILVRGNEVYINGENLNKQAQEKKAEDKYFKFTETMLGGEKSYTIQRHEAIYGRDEERELEFLIPDGHYFFMGDNRDKSSDSRYWGVVPRKYIKGRAFYIYLSSDPASFWPKLRWHQMGNSI